MKIPAQDRNPQAFLDERQNATEIQTQTELQNNAEFLTPTEQISSEELPSPTLTKSPTQRERREKESQERQQKLLSQYMVMAVAATFTVAVSVGVLPLAKPAPKPTFTVQAENIGLTAFACDLYIENTDQLTLQATLTQGGENLRELPLTGTGVQSLGFENLLPENEYTVQVVDQEGKAYFSHSFTTDPFVTFFEPTEGKRAFALHEEISLQYDTSIALFSEDGREFSNIMFDPEGTNYLYETGLYAGEYFFTATLFLPEAEEPTVYQKKMTLGDLTPLVYTAEVNTFLDYPLSLVKTAGDTFTYENFSIVLSQGENYEVYHYIDTADIIVEGDRIEASLPADIAAGTYDIRLTGEIAVEDNLFYNEIWKGTITVTL